MLFRRSYNIFFIKRKMSEFVTVSISQGKLKGKKVVNKYGTAYYSFHGIPYAKPPVGNLRFKAPQAPESWEGIREAFSDGSDAPQICFIKNHYIGNEDCLFLNVHSLEVSSKSLKPVMVWIHGGGFQFGSGSLDFYGPDYIMQHDVVLVTINYRLGVLGYLYLEGTDVSPNNGLKDQVAALKWVQENIVQFGGDPNNVTIFGESAGGASVHYHMLSPMSKGLFHRAIAMSGSALNPWAYVDEKISQQRAFKLGEILGFKTNNASDLARFLLAASSKTLIENQILTFDDKDKLEIFKLPFVPCKDSGPEAFLPEEPVELMTKGKFNYVPYMTGVTSEEGKLILETPFQNFLPPLEDYNNEFNHSLPRHWIHNQDAKTLEEISKQLKRLYFKDMPITSFLSAEFVNLQSDVQFILGILKTVEKIIAQSKSPVLLYKFCFEGPFTFLDYFGVKTDVPGASHADDLSYLFRSAVLQNDLEQGSKEYNVSFNLCKLFTNFAKTGNPNSDLNISWLPVKASSQPYLKISNDLTVEYNLFKEKYDFWQPIFNKIGLK